MQKVEELLNTYKTCEKLRERHSKQLREKLEKGYLKDLGNELKKQNYMKNGQNLLGQKAQMLALLLQEENRRNQYRNKATYYFKEFSDVTNTKSLAYWTIQNKPSLSHEQESVLFNLDAILIEKPVSIEKNAQYVPKPETFFRNLEIGEKESNPNGFWVGWGGIRRFVPYIPERFSQRRIVTKLWDTSTKNTKMQQKSSIH